MSYKTNLFASVLFLSLFVSKSFAQNWQLVWSDEFTTTIGPDWVIENLGGGFGNNELQYYRPQNATVQNGNLVITAKNESFGGANYTSAKLVTKGLKSWKYGKIEARISIPSFSGAWPAFWMLGDNIDAVSWPSCGEIDIMEHVNTESQVHGTLHWDNNGQHAQYGLSTTLLNPTAFHIYTAEWTPSSIRIFLDGVQYYVINTSNNFANQAFDKNFFIILNLAIGGNWPGFNIDTAAFPAEMKVDYVRVYQDATLDTENFDITNDLSLMLYPNPSKDLLKLQSNANLDKAKISIVDTTGKEVLKSEINAEKTVSIAALTSGLYVLRIVSNEGIVAYKKFIKE